MQKIQVLRNLISLKTSF